MHYFLFLLCILRGHRLRLAFSSKSVSKVRTVTWRRFTCRRCKYSFVRTRSIPHTR